MEILRIAFGKYKEFEAIKVGLPRIRKRAKEAQARKAARENEWAEILRALRRKAKRAKRATDAPRKRKSK